MVYALLGRLRLAAAMAAAVLMVAVLSVTPGVANAEVKPLRLGVHYVTKSNGADLHRSPGGEVIWVLSYGQQFDVEYSPEGVWCLGTAPGIQYFEERDSEAYGWVLCGDLNP